MATANQVLLELLNRSISFNVIMVTSTLSTSVVVKTGKPENTVSLLYQRTGLADCKRFNFLNSHGKWESESSYVIAINSTLHGLPPNSQSAGMAAELYQHFLPRGFKSTSNAFEVYCKEGYGLASHNLQRVHTVSCLVL